MTSQSNLGPNTAVVCKIPARCRGISRGLSWKDYGSVHGIQQQSLSLTCRLGGNRRVAPRPPMYRVHSLASLARPEGTSVIEPSSKCKISSFCRRLIDSGMQTCDKLR